MIRKLWMICVALCLNNVTAIADDVSATAPPEKPGMRTLFNGQDLSGWDGDPRLWSVKDGVIHGETTEQNPTNGNTFILWKEGRTKNFELRVTFRSSRNFNSGIQYRSKHITDEGVKNAWVVKGYQFEIRNENHFPNVSGFIYDEGKKRGRVCLVGEQVHWDKDEKHVLRNDLIDEPTFQKLFKLDDWNEAVIIAQGNRVLHYLNNTLVVNFEDSDPERNWTDGILALQLHQGKPGWAEFKNLRIRDLE